MERKFYSSAILFKPDHGWFNFPDTSVVVSKDYAFLISPHGCVQLDPGDQFYIRYRLSPGRLKTMRQDDYRHGGSYLKPKWLCQTEEYIVDIERHGQDLRPDQG